MIALYRCLRPAARVVTPMAAGTARSPSYFSHFGTSVSAKKEAGEEVEEKLMVGERRGLIGEQQGLMVGLSGLMVCKVGVRDLTVGKRGRGLMVGEVGEPGLKVSDCQHGLNACSPDLKVGEDLTAHEHGLMAKEGERGQTEKVAGHGLMGKEGEHGLVAKEGNQGQTEKGAGHGLMAKEGEHGLKTEGGKQGQTGQGQKKEKEDESGHHYTWVEKYHVLVMTLLALAILFQALFNPKPGQKWRSEIHHMEMKKQDELIAEVRLIRQHLDQNEARIMNVVKHHRIICIKFSTVNR